MLTVDDVIMPDGITLTLNLMEKKPNIFRGCVGYIKGDYKKNVEVVIDADSEVDDDECVQPWKVYLTNVRKFDAWGSGEGTDATIDVYFGDGTEVTFYKVRNISFGGYWFK